jgi:diguanylate cyclase (GGDEF)-like protein
VAQAIRGASLRPADVVARYGGEEFALLPPQTPRLGAEHLAHRVLDAVEALSIPHEASPTARHVTVSIAWHCYDEDSACWMEPSADSRVASVLPRGASDLAQCADTVLYATKSAGQAQGWWLGIDDVDAPTLAREIAPVSRSARGREAL